MIARVEALAADQPEMLTFTDRHGRLVGNHDALPGVLDADNDVGKTPGVDPNQLDPVIDDAVELPGVDVAAVDAQHDVEIMDDLDVNNFNRELIIVETVEEEPVVPMAPAAQEAPAVSEADGLRRSGRIQTQPRAYEPTLTGSKYAYAVTQLESHGVLHPDAHSFVQEGFYQAEPNIVASIMTQLSLKAGLKTWGNNALTAVRSETKQLHF